MYTYQNLLWILMCINANYSKALQTCLKVSGLEVTKSLQVVKTLPFLRVRIATSRAFPTELGMPERSEKVRVRPSILWEASPCIALPWFGTQLTIYISFPRRKSWELILSAIKRQNINWVLVLHGHVDVRAKDSREVENDTLASYANVLFQKHEFYWGKHCQCVTKYALWVSEKWY